MLREFDCILLSFHSGERTVAGKRRRIKRDEAEEDIALVSVVCCCKYSFFPTLFFPLSYPIISPGLWISFLAEYSTSYYFLSNCMPFIRLQLPILKKWR
jgi:hypothetical protein